MSPFSRPRCRADTFTFGNRVLARYQCNRGAQRSQNNPREFNRQGKTPCLFCCARCAARRCSLPGCYAPVALATLRAIAGKQPADCLAVAPPRRCPCGLVCPARFDSRCCRFALRSRRSLATSIATMSDVADVERVTGDRGGVKSARGNPAFANGTSGCPFVSVRTPAAMSDAADAVEKC